MCNKLMCVFLILEIFYRVYTKNCQGPQMRLVSDDPRRTCTSISASSDRIDYRCTTLISDFPRAMIKYCPIEVCQENGTWSKPSISCALSECYVSGLSQMYVGHRICTSSGRLCQRWDSQEPHRHRFQKSDMFPDHTIALAEAFCRDPEGSKGAPWCFTTDPDKKWETCDVIDCVDIARYDGFCGFTPTMPPKDSDEADDVTKNKNSGKCSNMIDYSMHKDHRIKSKVLDEKNTRSLIECTTLCSRMTSCTAITFRHEDHVCTLHGGKDLMLVKSRGYNAGTKTCMSQ